MSYTAWSKDGVKMFFTETIDDVTSFQQAVNACWNLCYDELERLREEEEISIKCMRKELTQLNRWYKAVKAEPSKAETFYLFDKPYAFLKEE